MAQLVCPQTVDAPPRTLEELIALFLRWYEQGNPWETSFKALEGEECFFEAIDRRTFPNIALQLEWQSPTASEEYLKWIEQAPKLTDGEADTLSDWLGSGEAPDIGSHFQIIEDRETCFPGGDSTTFVREYVRELPLGWCDSVVVFLHPGEQVVVVRWTPDRVQIRDVRKWADRTDVDSDGCGRWHVLESFDGEVYARVPIPPSKPTSADAHAARASLVAMAAPKPAAGASGIHTTGIAALDSVLAIGGVPLRGARCIVQAPTANAKTTFALEIAEHYAAAGIGVVWIATRDESPATIIERRHQRMGRTREEAIKLAAAGDVAGLCDQMLVLDGREWSLEDVLAVRDGFDVLFIDPLQKVRTRSGGTGVVESVGAALELIELSGITTWMTSAFVRGGMTGRRSRFEMSKGGAGVENGATLLLDLERKGDALTLRVLKSRYGGEDETLALTLDRERQRVHSPTDAPTDAEARIQAEVLAALKVSPRSRRWFETNITGKAATVRRVVQEMIEAGALTLVGARVSLA